MIKSFLLYAAFIPHPISDFLLFSSDTFQVMEWQVDTPAFCFELVGKSSFWNSKCLQ